MSETCDVDVELREPSERLDGFLACNVEWSENRLRAERRDVVACEEHAIVGEVQRDTARRVTRSIDDDSPRQSPVEMITLLQYPIDLDGRCGWNGGSDPVIERALFGRDQRLGFG